MKTMSSKTALVFMSILSLILTSCMDEKFNDINSKLNFANFEFKTTKQVKVNVTTLNTANQPFGGVFVELYSKNPLNADGSLIANSTDYLMFKGLTNSEGKLNCELAPATTVDSLHVLVNHIGLPTFQQYKLSSNELNITIGGTVIQTAAKKVISNIGAATLPNPTKDNGYYILGTWKNDGTPKYLWPTNDVIDNEFLTDINASLPERIKLPVSHPEYLTTTDEGNIVLIEDAEVWITFVHEGAGFLNTLGYYTHQNDKAPTTKSGITDATIVYPNISLVNLGGGLVSGNKVQLLYLDPVTLKYTTRFPSGTTIAWFLTANGFGGSRIGAGYGTYYSDKRFNPEVALDKKKHNVILNDTKRKLLLIGFEDLQREQSSDDDFNDAVFYSTVTPYTAVKTENYKPIDTPKDADGDGVTDSRDEYPNDKNKAFNNYYPGKNQVGTLAFEDLWPNKGDYDFNDLVIDYNFNQITNAQNLIVEINAALTVKAIGASLRNPFAIAFNTAPDNIKSVTGQQLNKKIFELNTNGTEMKQAKAVIPVFDDPYNVLGFTGSIVNTVNGGAYSAPKTINLKIELNNPVSLSSLGAAPYNPFIVVGGERSKEVHLPGSAPTDLVDATLFGTGDDNTDLKSQKYYLSDKYLPWAINLPVQFAYPAEKQDITKAYLMFNNWANSRGYNYMDWYQNLNGYRDATKLFVKK
jgi:LruC domain-containing protein